MKTIERKEYNKPVIVVVKVESVKIMANTGEATEPGTGYNGSRNFRNSFFEDDE